MKKIIERSKLKNKQAANAQSYKFQGMYEGERIMKKLETFCDLA